MTRTVVLVVLAAAAAGCRKEASHGSRPVSAWQQDLRSPDAGTRRAAADALGTVGEKAKVAVADLAALLKDPNDKIRIPAAQALWGMAAKAGPPVRDLPAALKARNAVG